MIQLETGYRVCAVPTELISQAWGAVRPWVEEAVSYSYGTLTPEDVYTDLEQGLAALWIAEAGSVIYAACITQLVPYPRGVSLRIWLLAGEDMAFWRDGIALLEAFARSRNCRFIEAVTRPGMAKLAKDLGFEVKRAFIVKPLDLGTH